MSYILAGPSLTLGPCLASMVRREVARTATMPIVCLSCSRMLSMSTATGTGPRFLPLTVTPDRQHRLFHTTNTVTSFSNRLGWDKEVMGVNQDNKDLYQQARASIMFSHKSHTNFPTSLLGLGGGGPANVNLSFSAGPDLSSGVSYRFMHTSSMLEKQASSKVEETVIRLKEKQNEALTELSRAEDLEKKIKSVIEEEDLAVKVSIEQKKSVAPPDQRTVWEKVVAEAKHYYSGFKLLFLDVKVSTKIIWKVLNGKTLSRRENRQLVRTVSDLFRLVPFSVFIIVPFMELLLPVALKLFPGMLPSTFTSQDEREVKMRRALKAKLEYARFLQKTLDEMGPTDKGHRSQSATDFVHFYNNVKKSGGAVDSGVLNKDILKFSKLFEDSITLDNMTRGQLVAICRLIDLTPIGTNAFLRFQIEMQLRKLKADDVIIAKEGIEQLTVTELQNACKDRGMRALGMTKEKLVQQLKQWIELSTNEQVPPSLLLLSRTLYLSESLAPVKAIEASISALPEAVATGAKAKIGEREGKIENVTRLEIIQQEQAKIEEEQQEQERVKVEKARKAEEEKAKAEKMAQAALEKAIEEQQLGVPPTAPPSVERVLTEAATVLRRATVSQEGEVAPTTTLDTMLESPMVTVRHTVASNSDDIHVGRADVMQESAPPKKPRSAIEEEMSADDLAALKAAIETITAEKGQTYITDHQVLGELRQELVDYQEDVGEMQEVAEIAGRKNLRQGKGAARLFKKVNGLLGKVDTVVAKLQTREKKLTTDISSLEVAGESAEVQESHLVTVQDLLGAVRRLQEVPDSNMLERISEVVASMDEDSDGVVKVEHVNKVIEILGRDNVELSGKQVKQIVDLIGKEEMLEVEGRIEKILGKMPILEIETKAVAETTVAPVENVATSSKPLEKNVTESTEDNLLVDKAEELNEQEVPEHIAEMFSRPVGEKKAETKLEETDTNDKIEDTSRVLSRHLQENVKNVVNSDNEVEELEKVPRTNGSK